MTTTADDPTGIFCKIIDASETIPLRHSVLWPNAPISQVLLPEDDKGIHIGAFMTRGTGVTDHAHIVDEPDDSQSGLAAVISLFLESWPEESERSMIDNTSGEARSNQASFGDAPLEGKSAAGEGEEEGRRGHESAVVAAVRFRKFACDSSVQGRGIGTKLLEYASQTIAKQQLGARVIWCDARVATADWYRKRGMVEFGETFFKSGVEYVRMKREF